MASVPNGVKTLSKISIAWVGRTNVTDRRQTDGRRHEREFTFAKNQVWRAPYWSAAVAAGGRFSPRPPGRGPKRPPAATALRFYWYAAVSARGRYDCKPCDVRGLTLTAFDIDDLIDKSDRKLFRRTIQQDHFLRHLLPPKTSTYSSYQLRKRQHPYLLPTVQYSQFKNSYVNRCLFK